MHYTHCGLKLGTPEAGASEPEDVLPSIPLLQRSGRTADDVLREELVAQAF